MYTIKIAVVASNNFTREGIRFALQSPTREVFAQPPLSHLLPGLQNEAQLDLVVISFAHPNEIEAEMLWLGESSLRMKASRTVALMDTHNQDAVCWVAAQNIDAILPHSTPLDVFPHLLEMILLGQRMFPAAVHSPPAQTRLTSSSLRPSTPMRMDQQWPNLSEREKTILSCLMNGTSNKSIAKSLSITETTVKAHVKGLLRKLGVTNRTQAAIWALNQEDLAQGSGSATPSSTASRPSVL